MIAGEALRLLQALLMFLTGSAPEPAQLRDVACLASNVWFEARGSPFADKLAVAQVVLNRVRDPAHPNTICEVVHEPAQFSWTVDEQPDEVRITNRIERDAWLDSILAAVSAIEGRIPDLASGATHFHAASISPEWSRAFEYVARWGGHRYYRPGRAQAEAAVADASRRRPPTAAGTGNTDPPQKRVSEPVLLRPVAGGHGLDAFWRKAAPLRFRSDATRAGPFFAWLYRAGEEPAAGPSGSQTRPRGNRARR